MKAAVFHKPHDIRYENVPDPKIEVPTDAIIRVTATAICGSDLHIYNGFFPQPRPMILGHEFMGIVEDVGSDVKRLKRGDRVVVPFPISCGHCFFCEQHVPTGCENSNLKNYGPKGELLSQKGAALFGYTDMYGGYDGGQAEAVRVPFADVGPRVVPEGLTDEQVLFLTDIFPTGWTGVDKAGVEAGQTVAIFGCGPVGLMAQKAAAFRGARVIAVDVLPDRLNMAREVCGSETINGKDVDASDKIIEMTRGHGADVSIDAVGLEAKASLFEKAANTVIHHQAGSAKIVEHAIHATRRGGKMSILGVYGSNYDNFPLSSWMDKGLQIWAGQAPVHNYIDELMLMVEGGKIKLDDIITHPMKLSDVAKGYDVFNKKEDHCVKVVMKP